jgi:hypothetical protein
MPRTNPTASTPDMANNDNDTEKETTLWQSVPFEGIRVRAARPLFQLPLN